MSKGKYLLVSWGCEWRLIWLTAEPQPSSEDFVGSTENKISRTLHSQLENRFQCSQPCLRTSFTCMLSINYNKGMPLSCVYLWVHSPLIVTVSSDVNNRVLLTLAMPPSKSTSGFPIKNEGTRAAVLLLESSTVCSSWSSFIRTLFSPWTFSAECVEVKGRKIMG